MPFVYLEKGALAVLRIKYLKQGKNKFYDPLWSVTSYFTTLYIILQICYKFYLSQVYLYENIFLIMCGFTKVVLVYYKKLKAFDVRTNQ